MSSSNLRFEPFKIRSFPTQNRGRLGYRSIYLDESSGFHLGFLHKHSEENLCPIIHYVNQCLLGGVGV